MNGLYAELYARICAFDIDGGASAFPFAARLARENGWSAARAARAIEEYRKFVLLAVAAGHPVSPSKAVDQVWHLHLTYTRSYWDAFCGGVLQTPLHHHPTRGGAAEQAKFDDGYRATLASYQRIFGHAPPRDLWPDPEERRRDAGHLQWVDRSRHLILPKPRWIREGSRGSVFAWAGLALLLLLVGCAASEAGARSPLDPRSLDFRPFCAAASAAALTVAGALRWLLRGPGGKGAIPRKLDVMQVAYLNGGAALAAETALGSLIARGALALDPVPRTLSQSPTERFDVPPDGLTAYRSARPAGWVDALHPLERFAYELVGSRAPEPARLDDVREALIVQAERLRGSLVNDGLVLEDDGARVTRAPTLVALGAPLLGVYGIAVEQQRDRPVGLFVVLCIVSAVVCLSFRRRPRRTRRGDAALDHLQHERRSLQTTGAGSAGRDPVMAMATFGLGVLSDGPLAAFAKALERPQQDGGGGGPSCGCDPGCGP